MGFKTPSTAGFNKKAEALIPDRVSSEKAIKFINHYSHSATILRPLEFPDLKECCDVVKTVLEAVEQIDKIHFDHLVHAITNQTTG
jgi:hypothetical protein